MRYLVLLGLAVGLSADVDTLNPVADVFILTYGGGEGGNTFLKFDISSIPTTSQIDSVILESYVWEVNNNWDTDVNYWNVNSQTWAETDSSSIIWQIPTSDSTLQSSGFGDSVGWARSVDLTNIFNRDYQASNTFCSIKMKDPDDPTFNPQPGTLPNDSNDSLMVGNGLGNREIYFYPHEHGTQIPRLIVYYMPPEVEEENITHLQGQRNGTIISGPLRLPKGKNCKVYDISGRTVVVKNLKPGIYFIEIDGRIERKVVKIR